MYIANWYWGASISNNPLKIQLIKYAIYSSFTLFATNTVFTMQAVFMI